MATISLNEFMESFNGEQNYFYGHGTGRMGGNVAKSILQQGLINEGTRLEHTAVGLSPNHTETKNELLNWGHLNSKHVVVIEIPKQLVDNYKRHKFINSMNSHDIILEPRKNMYGDEGSIIPTGFIRGYVDAENQTFVENPNFLFNGENREVNMQNTQKQLDVKYAEVVQVDNERRAYLKNLFLPQVENADNVQPAKQVVQMRTQSVPQVLQKPIFKFGSYKTKNSTYHIMPNKYGNFVVWGGMHGENKRTFKKVYINEENRLIFDRGDGKTPDRTTTLQAPRARFPLAADGFYKTSQGNIGRVSTDKNGVKLTNATDGKVLATGSRAIVTPDNMLHIVSGGEVKFSFGVADYVESIPFIQSVQDNKAFKATTVSGSNAAAKNMTLLFQNVEPKKIQLSSLKAGS